MEALAPASTVALQGPSLRQRLAARGFDAVTLLVVPAAIFSLLLFVYPFAFGFILSFEPKAGGNWLANYQRFFSDSFLYETIAKTLWLAVPVTAVNLVLAVPIAFRVRLMRHQRLLTTILVLPITLGTVLIAWLSASIVLLLGNVITARVGARGLIALERLMGMFLVAMSVEMLLSGISRYFETLGR